MSHDHPSNPVGSKILYEDDVVRVWDATVEPGGTLAIHFHDLDYVTVALTEGDIEAHEADGTVRASHRLVGDIQVTKVGTGQTHSLKNVGTTPYSNRIIELKQHGLTDVPAKNVNISAKG